MTVDMIPWVVARATGLVAYGLLAGAMLAGLLVRTRDRAGSLKGAAMVDLHRHLSLLALVLTAVHGVALVLDDTAAIAPLDLVVPGLAPYRPLWTGLGVIAAEAFLVVRVSSRFRTRIGARAWRRLHLLAYLVFAAATAHGLAAGTDRGVWALALYGGATGAVAALTGWRAMTARRGSAAARRGPKRQTPGMGEDAGMAPRAGS